MTLRTNLPLATATAFPYSWTQPPEGLQPDDTGLFAPLVVVFPIEELAPRLNV